MRTFVFCILFALSAAPCAARADGMQSSLQDMFNNLGSASNFTSPGHMSGPNGGVVSGGSIFIRNHMMSPSLYSFTAPHISGSCGGLDLFGGSFSYINSQQLEQYLKQIASNASTYAFTLGLKALCPACLDEMEKMQTWTQKMNAGLLNSCQAAHSLVDSTGLKDLAAERWQEYLAQSGQTTNGSASDSFAASAQGPGQPSAISGLLGSDPTTAAQILQGNVVWRALQDGNVASLFQGGDNTFDEDIMSLTGTVITCVPAGQGGSNSNGPATCPAGVGTGAADRPGDPVQIPQPHTMSLSDLVFGGKDTGGIQRLTCDNQEQCLGPTPQADTSFKGLGQMIKDAFLGSNIESEACDTSDGIIARYLAGSGSAPSSTDFAYINNTGNFGKEVMAIAKQDPEAACSFAYDWADVAAADMAFYLANDALNATARAVATSHRDYTGKVATMIADARRRIYDDHAKILREHTTNAASLTNYLDVIKTLGPPQMPQLPAPVTVQ